MNAVPESEVINSDLFILKGVNVELVPNKPLYGPRGQGIDTSIRRGECVVFLGPSGCGKSTLIRLLLGLRTPDEGGITWQHLDGKSATVSEQWRPNAGVVFQRLELFSHMSALDNIRFPLSVRGINRKNGSQHFEKLAELTRLMSLDDEVLNRKPDRLSGGQRQRVAIARALSVERDVFVFDEPFASLDMPLRWELNRQLADLRRRVLAGKTIVFVTHHQDEAMALGDRILVFQNGKGIVQGADHSDGTPTAIYERPKTWFVAEFIGTPPINWIQAVKDSTTPAVQAADGSTVRVNGVTACRFSGDSSREGRIAFRPENVILSRPGDSRPDSGLSLFGEVDAITYQGAYSVVEVRLSSIVESPTIRVRCNGNCLTFAAGQPVQITVKAGDLLLFEGRKNADHGWEGDNCASAY